MPPIQLLLLLWFTQIQNSKLIEPYLFNSYDIWYAWKGYRFETSDMCLKITPFQIQCGYELYQIEQCYKTTPFHFAYNIIRYTYEYEYDDILLFDIHTRFILQWSNAVSNIIKYKIRIENVCILITKASQHCKSIYLTIQLCLWYVICVCVLYMHT